jgi:hypothetical protein
MQARPVVGQQLGGQVPVLRRLRMADRLHRQLVPGEPGRGQLVQRGDLTRLGAAQFQPQQVGEQMVVAEPGAGCVQ